MSLLARTLSVARENRGGVLVLVALFVPVALLFCAFVVDAGDAWWHQRHLQVQADAAALAAAQDLAASPCSDSVITQDVYRYGGYGTSAYNQQVGGSSPRTGTVQPPAINSPTFPGQTSPVDSTVATGTPCNSNMLDVKMTETNLPFFFPALKSALNVFPDINAHARVELKQATTSSNSMPIAVNDVAFPYAEAYFVDATPGDVGTVLGKVALNDTHTVSNSGLEVWTSASAVSLTVPSDPTPSGTPTAMTHPDADVGVRIALAGVTRPTGDMATDCGPTGTGGPAGTMCFDGSGVNAPLLDVHGFNPTGTGSPTSPVNHGVIMTPGSCSDQYYAVSASACADGLRATLDLGTVPTGATVTVTAVVGGTSYPLSQANCPAGTAPAAPLTAWCTNAAPITAASGVRTPVDLQVVYTPSGKKPTPVTTTFSNAQSTYVGNGSTTTSGPIQALTLSTTSAAVCSLTGATPPCSDTSALPEGTAYPVTVTLGVTPSISVAKPGDPPVTMRFSGVGSQNQSVNCVSNTVPPQANLPNDNFLDAIAVGCLGVPGPGNSVIKPIVVNPTLSCPGATPVNDCVPPYTGNKQNQAAAALNWRILKNASTCTAPNHWPNYQQGDPRIVTVFITPYGSFGGKGTSTQFPVQAFAAFYVTGWQGQGQGNTNPCQPSSGGTDDPAAAGTIVGHFIHYTQLVNDGSGSTQTCVANSLNECVAVMTR
jgi:Flp pilus assembly protein TadG